MRKDAFYSGKRVVRVEWWLHECDLPDTIRWARLRVFQDGSADACFEEGGKLHAFDARDHAARILSEDEYCSIEGMDRADEREFGFDVAQLAPPDWVDPQDQAFEYHGTY